MSEEGWGGGLRRLHWISEGRALCRPKLKMLGGVEQMISEDYMCKHCRAMLFSRDLERDS